jgi:hypothetical protein
VVKVGVGRIASIDWLQYSVVHGDGDQAG